MCLFNHEYFLFRVSSCPHVLLWWNDRLTDDFMHFSYANIKTHFSYEWKTSFCVEFWSCRSKYTLLALSYYWTQKCSLGGPESENTSCWLEGHKVYCSHKRVKSNCQRSCEKELAKNLSANEKNEDYGDAVGGKEKEAQWGKCSLQHLKWYYTCLCFCLSLE